jgi:hypothetical protein
MFTNAQRQVERTGRYGTPREQYLQVGPCFFLPASLASFPQGLVLALADPLILNLHLAD